MVVERAGTGKTFRGARPFIQRTNRLIQASPLRVQPSLLAATEDEGGDAYAMTCLLGLNVLRVGPCDD
ncbi:MAG: hypothetical protein M3O70_28035 [Actinomycetota bacterium]|nr:hypothetical protein [Actinomycetota bacterium]